MKFAFSSPTNTKAELDTLFYDYRKLGYEGLQLKHAQFAPYIQKPTQFLEKWGEIEGVASALITGGNLDDENQQQLRSVFDFASKVGTERIVFCHGIPRNQVSNDDIIHFANLLSELGREATEQYGVRLSLHHHYDQPVMHREDFDLFFEHVKGNSVCLTVDTAHLIKSGITNISEVVYSFKDRIDNFHMKDIEEGEWKVLGEGSIDFTPVFQSIKEIDYKGWVSADEESEGDLKRGMEVCYNFMKTGLSR
ncbi:sugar phosphate isomerase/epimerase family protein [Halalkalibacter alkaliphilus]|uniref:Sugar phosphate isomerase/epimerase n=1 Tax=Halalkalibacter alkaliphilus TaxID=2917993 RepID=A0A9X2I7S1_9BACI|nr:sugar phosphate isomerase/epimerase [Halalkalibacter alkaliphilus]MCL7749931.1 sugar phosphate isomerase/epimerase [Halalkalibacter alkaliphilus]